METSLDPESGMKKHLLRIAFFGGSFDPPHLGHLAVARAARSALHLDTILFAPVGAQPLKPHGSTAPYLDRLQMTRLAIAGEAGFEISLADAPHPDSKPNYTLETLRRLCADLPPGGELFCLMGADSFVNLRKWRGGAEIPFAATLVVASRPGQSLADLTAALPTGIACEPQPAPCAPDAVELLSYRLRNDQDQAASFYLLPGLHVDISASAIRDQVRAADNQSASGASLLPPPVAEYIRAHGLYR